MHCHEGHEPLHRSNRHKQEVTSEILSGPAGARWEDLLDCFNTSSLLSATVCCLLTCIDRSSRGINSPLYWIDLDQHLRLFNISWVPARYRELWVSKLEYSFNQNLRSICHSVSAFQSIETSMASICPNTNPLCQSYERARSCGT